MPRIRMFKNFFAFWSSIALIFCLTDVSCQRQKCLGTSRYCSGQHGNMKSVCREGYCVCTGQHYDYNTCLPDAYGCRIEINSNTVLAKPQYNNQPATTIYSCVPGSSSTQYEVHVLSVYEGNRHTRPPSAGDTNVNIISGGRSSKPVILVLASYEPVNWILNLPAGIIISRVILVAYYADESSVTGDVNQVQAVRRRGTRHSQWRRGYGSDLGGGDTVGLLERVYNRFGVVTSFTGTYKADEWSLVLSSPQGARLGFFSNGSLGSLATTAVSSSKPTRIQTFISKATHTAISTSTPKPTSTSTSRLTSKPTKRPRLRFQRPIIKAAPKATGGAMSTATTRSSTTPTSTLTSIPIPIQTFIQTSISTSTHTSTTTTTTTPTLMLPSIIKPTSATPTSTPTSRATHRFPHMPTSTSTPAHVGLLTLERHRQRCNTFSNHSSDCLGQYGKMKSACRDGYCVCTGQDYDYSTCLPNAYGCRIQVNTDAALAKPRYHNQQPRTIYSCTPADSSPQYEVHVLSVHEVVNRHPPSAGDVAVNVVNRGRSDRRIILVLVSYEPVNWILYLPAGISISKVILVAYYLAESSVSGDVKRVQVVERRSIHDLQWSVGYGSDSGGGDTVGLLRQVYNRFGVVSSFTGTYRADEWSLVLLSSPHEQSSPPFHVAATSISPTENDNPKPRPWIFAVYTFVVVLLTASFTVLFIRCRQRKSRREAREKGLE